MMRDGLSDLNDGTIDGVYYCSSGDEINAPITGRRLIVNVTSFNGRISQMAISEKGESYSRFSINQVWSAWQRLDNFGYNSLAELSAGVAQNIGYGFKTGNLNEKADNILQNAILLHANTDSTLPGAYGTLMSFAPTTSHITQLYSVADSDLNNLYFRQRTGGIWSSWRKI